MATVRISNELKHHVRKHIEGMFTTRFEKLDAEMKSPALGLRCYEAMLPHKERELAKQLNAGNGKWLRLYSQFWMHLEYVNTAGRKVTRRFDIFLDPPQPVPFDTSYGMNIAVDSPIAKELLPLAQKFDALDKERSDLIRSLVDGVLEKCSTLAQVLKIWPSALDYMPESTRAKHYEAAAARKNPAEEIVIDEATKATLFKAQLMQ